MPGSSRLKYQTGRIRIRSINQDGATFCAAFFLLSGKSPRASTPMTSIAHRTNQNSQGARLNGLFSPGFQSKLAPNLGIKSKNARKKESGMSTDQAAPKPNYQHLRRNPPIAGEA